MLFFTPRTARESLRVLEKSIPDALKGRKSTARLNRGIKMVMGYTDPDLIFSEVQVDESLLLS